MLGYTFIAKAHANGLNRLPMFFPGSPELNLEVICGRTEEAVSDAAEKFGFERYETDWEKVIQNENVDIFANLGPNNLHEQPSVKALMEGKHVMCEKPLAESVESAKRMVEASEDLDLKTAVGFNYRFIPAIQLAKSMIEKGELGKIYQFRGQYLQDWLSDPETPWSWKLDSDAAGAGTLGDLGSHALDLARFLIGDIKSVAGHLKTFVEERPVPNKDGTNPVTVDDACSILLNFDNGAMGTIEASRYATGNKNNHRIEVHGSKGSIRFSLERLNELELYKRNEEEEGYKTILVTENEHPFIDSWWPSGHIIGWEHAFVHEWYCFLKSIANDTEYKPNFRDGLKVQKIIRAVQKSDQLEKWVEL